MRPRVTLKFAGYLVQGTAVLNLWGGGKGSIKMRPYFATNKKQAIAGINDNGFGCEYIEKAYIEMIPSYDGWHDWDNVKSFVWINKNK